MTNPFTILLALALWEIIKYAARNLRGMASDAYHASSVGCTEYEKMKAFKQAPMAEKHGSIDSVLEMIKLNRAERHKRWEEEAKTYSPEKQAAIHEEQRYFVGGF